MNNFIICFLLPVLPFVLADDLDILKDSILGCGRYRPSNNLNGSIPSILAQNDLTALAAMFEKTGLTDLLSGPGPFTVFAPTNDAFDDLDSLTLGTMVQFDSILKRMLNSHILPFALPYASLTNELTTRTLSKEFIRVNVYDVGQTEIITVNGALRLKTIEASNGIIYVIDKVLQLRKVDSFAEVLKSRGVFSIFLAALKAAHLNDILEGGMPMTLFVPTDDAFRALPPNLVASLTSNIQELRVFLLHHVITSTSYSRGLTTGSLNLARGGRVQISVSELGIQVSGARVIEADLGATNGVIHIINQVI